MLASNLWAWAVGSAMCQDERRGDTAGFLWGDYVCGQLSLWDIPVKICLEFRTEVWARGRFAAISMKQWLKPLCKREGCARGKSCRKMCSGTPGWVELRRVSGWTVPGSLEGT